MSDCNDCIKILNNPQLGQFIDNTAHKFNYENFDNNINNRPIIKEYRDKVFECQNMLNSDKTCLFEWKKSRGWQDRQTNQTPKSSKSKDFSIKKSSKHRCFSIKKSSVLKKRQRKSKNIKFIKKSQKKDKNNYSVEYDIIGDLRGKAKILSGKTNHGNYYAESIRIGNM